MIENIDYSTVLSKHPFSSEQLTSQEADRLKNLETWEFSFEEYVGVYYKVFTKRMVSALLTDYKVYFIFFESFPQKRTKMRTFKKMFYKQKQELGKRNIYELEIVLDDDRSVLAGIIRLDEKNIKTVIDSINSNFAFGLIVPKSKRSFASNRADFLMQLKEYMLQNIKASKINILKTLTKVLNKNKAVFTLDVFKQEKEGISMFSSIKNDFNPDLRDVLLRA